MKDVECSEYCVAGRGLRVKVVECSEYCVAGRGMPGRMLSALNIMLQEEVCREGC